MLGGLGPQGLKEPVFGAKINGNREEYLNLDCTFQYLANHPEASTLPFLAELENSDIPMPPAARNVVTLRDCLSYSGAPEEKIQAIEASLKAIKNRK